MQLTAHHNTEEFIEDKILEEDSKTIHSAEHALAATPKRNIPTCNYCHKRGHTEANCWSKHGKPSNLPALPKPGTQPTSKPSHKAMMAFERVCHAEDLSTLTTMSEWLLDC